MSSLAIQASGVSKRYPIGATRRRHDTLRDAIAEGAKRLFSLEALRERKHKEEFWALHDVSFTLHRGEILGVIGKNGAGKTTLLKILSRITEPTTGEVRVFGRIGSLLEVGTGFHSELTGRENIFLNGAILGMTRKEIERKFDEIVAFAEVERFIDTPVKHYSSGMYLRLGFAVAAHLEPDILIVDEVLAVGDADFQNKCLGKMDAVAGEGRTVIFVSHNLEAIQRLCDRCLLIEEGRTVIDDLTLEVVRQYLEHTIARTEPRTTTDLTDRSRHGSGKVRFRRVTHASDSEELGFRAYSEGPLRVVVEIDAQEAMSVESLSVSVRTRSGLLAANADVASLGHPLHLTAGTNVIEFGIAALHLNPGRYPVGLWAGGKQSETYDYIREAFELDVHHEPSSAPPLVPGALGLVPTDFTVGRLRAFPAEPLVEPVHD